MEDFSAYSSLAETSYEANTYEEKEDFFHSVFISGKNREIEDGVIQKAGQLQIRNIVNNKTEINMIITHTKQVLVKSRTDQNKKNILECFCFKSGNQPYKGTSGNICGNNAAMRAANPFCSNCKSHIIAAGIYCDEYGKPITDSEGKPIFLFVRGQGVKYAGVADYLNKLSNLTDLEPIFTPVTDQTIKFEKMAVNCKRFVTKVTVGEVETQYGQSKVFKLDAGDMIPKETVMKMLEISKKTMDKFIEKFDWSKNKEGATGKQSFTPPVSNEQKFSEPNKINEPQKQEVKTQAPKTPDFDFSGIEW